MKALSASIKVGILGLLLLGGSYVVWKNLGSDSVGRDGMPLWARFRDASGLPIGSQVRVAGLPVGEITGLEIDGRSAKVQFKIRGAIAVWDSAVVIKKAVSLLGEHYLEVDPGSEETLSADGAKRTHTRLGPGAQVQHVVESVSTDEILRRIEDSLPNVDSVLIAVKDLADEVRHIVNGPLASVASRVDGLVQREAATVTSILDKANTSMTRIDAITKDIRDITGTADKRIVDILDNLEAAANEAKDLMKVARSEVQVTGEAVRAKLDRLDDVAEAASSIAEKIDNNQGTLGRLVNDPAIADNVEEITEGAKGFLGTIFDLKTYVGLRSEYNLAAAAARHYISVELHTRPDKFYLIEVERGPRGNYPEVTLEYDPTVDPQNWVRKAVITDSTRFTFQFAKRLGWLTLRYGIKESSGGVGIDMDVPWWHRSLRASVDVFDATFDKLPRMKITAAVEVFRHAYIVAGVDDLLNCSDSLALRCPDKLTLNSGMSDVPVQLSEYHFGRDIFVGGMIRFNDEDLAALLAIGGSALGGVVGK